jgi:hypothetical protein
MDKIIIIVRDQKLYAPPRGNPDPKVHNTCPYILEHII